MITRQLYFIAFSQEWGRQMRFITGPRQAGKTTLAKQKLKQEKSESLYYLWDLRALRQRYKENELFFTEDILLKRKKAWVCFDEIHKMPKWKNIVKAAFDACSEKYIFIVTGSSKLDIVRRAGDSLAGRYFTFHLFPLTLNELNRQSKKNLQIFDTANDYIEHQMTVKEAPDDLIDQLMTFSGFPEPFITDRTVFHKKWARDYIDTVIKEDIGSLTRITDREYIYDLYKLLPEMAGSPISLSSIASHLQISPTTVKNYLRRLEDFYLLFSIRPYSKNIKRSLLKAPKYYCYDWTRIQDKGARFENFVACELRTQITLWGDATGDAYDLFYIRNKEKQETDFLVVKNRHPWLLVETKVSDGRIQKHHIQQMEALNKIPFVQVCLEPGVCAMQGPDVYRLSAQRLFG
jgi:hypothetical protein